MKLRLRSFLSCLSLSSFLLCPFIPALAQATDTISTTKRPGKKLIEVGWDQPNTKQLRTQGQQMEETTPFDGVVYVLKFTAEGKVYDENKILTSTPWKKEWLSEPLADMKACRFTKFTDNFIRVNTAPGDLKWDDDKAWANAITNLGLVAWFAKNSGSKGIAFDPECYAESQYQWNPKGGLTFEKAQVLARKRGNQAMKAMAKAYPSLTFLAFWLLSLNSQNASAPDPTPSLRSEKYGLWPAFVAGLVEAAPATVKLVDANENGYYPDDRTGYLSLYNLMRGENSPLRNLLPDDVRAKYNRQVSAGFGFYLDRYLNLPSSNYYIAPLPGGTRIERLGINLDAAMASTDEYVWAYGEQCRWWERPGTTPQEDATLQKTVGKGRLWEEAMPGITAAMNSVRDPNIVLREAISRRTPLKNKAVNSGFEEEKPTGGDAKNLAVLDWQTGAVPGFAQWQDEASKGIFSWDKSAKAGKMQGVTDGCFIQKHPVRPGEKFLVEVEGKGAGERLLTVRWQTEDGKWINWDQDISFGFSRTAGGLEVARGLVTVPERTGQLVILLAVNHQKPDEACWFDNLGVYPLQALLKP